MATRFNDGGAVAYHRAMATAPLVGRERELSALSAALDAACAGRGGVCLVTGEPGIGKSHLVTAFADRAAERATVAFGRCWEAGGAPAYWPWVEALRTLLAGRGSLVRPGLEAAVVAELLPEIATTADVEPLPPLPPRDAQFRLFDAVVSVIRRCASERPLLIGLEDLHAADTATVALLEMVARSVSSAPLCVVGTYRVADARFVGLLDALGRASRRGETIHLGPLDAEGIARLVEAVIGERPAATLVRSVTEASEGNPLFAAELARLLHARGGELGSTAALPAQVGAVIGERVDRLPAGTTRALRVASVLGREVQLADAAVLLDVDLPELRRRLDPALEAGIVVASDASTHRFTHVLVREALYRGLAAAERAALHLRVAERLDARHVGDAAAPLSRIAHHYLEAGPEAGDRAVQMAVRAAERALMVLAHDEAAQLFERALSALEAFAPDASARRCALLLSAGHARLQAGDLETGREACRAASRLARELGSVELLARAALEIGSVFSFGTVDPELVALLEEALDALGDGHPGLRARVLARLAAALQPSPEPKTPIAMAHASIALARETGDDAVLLSVLRSAMSALMDFADPEERIPLNRDHVALARRLGEPAEAQRGRARLILDHLEAGDVESADRELEAYTGLARALGHPAFEWMASALAAMRAIQRGAFAEAEALREDARRHAARSGDPNAEQALHFQGYGLARARLDDEGAAALLEDIVGRSSFAAPFQDVLRCQRLVHLGDAEGLMAERRRPGGLTVATTWDPHYVSFVAEIAVASADVELARQAREALLPFADRHVSGGMVCLYNDGPLEHWLGQLDWLLGERAEASRRFDRAFERARAAGLVPAAARTAFEHGRRLSTSGDERHRARARELLGEVAAFAEAADLPELARRVETLGGAPTRPAVREAPVEPPRFEREGDVWAIRFAGRVVRVRSTKGLEILARLVEQPGRELHVLELGASGVPVVESSGLEAIDDRARAAYRRRAARLREELAEADAWNDLGRADRARAELEALEAELAGALGLGGRRRQTGRSAERARSNVQKRIRVAQKKIAEHDAALADHLERNVRTGVFCRYDPPD